MAGLAWIHIKTKNMRTTSTQLPTWWNYSQNHTEKSNSIYSKATIIIYNHWTIIRDQVQAGLGEVAAAVATITGEVAILPVGATITGEAAILTTAAATATTNKENKTEKGKWLEFSHVWCRSILWSLLYDWSKQNKFTLWTEIRFLREVLSLYSFSIIV